MEINWPVKKLGELIVLNYGKGISGGDREPDGLYPIYGANGQLGRTDKYLVEGEGIIIGRKGSAGEVTRVSGKFWPSDVTYYVFGNKEIDVDFLFYLFKNINLKRFAKGIKPGINRNDVYQLEIPLPSIEEQKIIVKKLEKILAKIEESCTLRQESIEEAQNVIRTKLGELFENNSWDEMQVSDIAEKPQYGFTASSTKEKIGPRLLRITDIQNGMVDWENVPYCKCNEVEKYKLISGDIVFARTGATTGKSFLIKDTPEKTVFASYLIRLKTKCSIKQEFLYWFFQSPQYWNQIIDHQAGSAQPNVNAVKLSFVKLRMPQNLKTQEKIVAYLDGLSEKVQVLQKLQQEQVQDLEALKQSVLHKAFQGEL